jgi:transposase
MLKKRVPQDSFYGSYLYDRIVPKDHLLRKINAVVDLSFVNDLVKDRYNPDFGRPAEDPEFMLRLCLLQYIYGDSDREVVPKPVSTWLISISWDCYNLPSLCSLTE